ncbi:LuxR C-terminal-related transcriptional regulator [Agromyces allii]|uniref:LuxR C-terminal-related transcriptional regulator n=1 Tax=Agromyces allii TaxID=393607 RepID=A0ABN2QWY6_9MICO|nr:LuxR C-terminal-related transcriptional regulator [Agromyces allii]
MSEHVSSQYLVDRPDLLRRIDLALDLPLTMVVAQAGAGKTVLLQQWVATMPRAAVAWLDIEREDDDPMRFSRRLIDALAGAGAAVGGLEHLAALSPGGLGGNLLDRLSTALASAPQTVIVLDDLHHLSNGALLADIGRLVASIPPNVHLVISTRVDPPIAWSRLRLRNRLLELRQSDLAMTRQESAELLRRITRRDLGAGTVDAIMSRTEGWAAGLQLAGLTLKFQSPSPSADFVTELNGSDRLIAEYLTEEVLDALPENWRMLLLRMAPLDAMTAELVDHVLERTDARLLFERLEHESMFLVAIDRNRSRVRFQQLFRDLLRYRLRAEDAAEERRLLARAADFHLARGELASAVEYLLRAGDWHRALDAIMTRGSEVFERGEMRTVIRWITAVPEHARAERLDVQLELGILVGMQGEPVLAVETLRSVASDPRATRGERTIVDTWISATAQWSARPDETLRAAERALDELADPAGFSVPDLMRLTTPTLLRTLATGSAGRSHFLLGDHAEAEAWIDRALATEGAAYPPFRIGLLGSLALLQAWTGRTVDAELLAVEAIETANAASLLAHPVMADAYLAQAQAAYEHGRTDAATAPLGDGALSAKANARTQMTWIARTLAALVAALEGRFEEALELTDLSAQATAPPAPLVYERLIAARMSVLRRSGRPEQALRLHTTDRRGIRSAPAVAQEAAAAALALGRSETAERLLSEPVDAGGAGSGAAHPRLETQRLMLHGWLAAARGSRPTALEFVEAALDQAEPDGLTAVFLESDPVVLDLVAELAAERGGLAEAIVALSPHRALADANSGLTEPLTDRELEILGYLPDHSTTAELAGRCFVSINTMKTHTAHIYRKLGVNGRSAAIARARELGVLAPQLSRSDQAGA